jgi:hypothetical protein
VYSNAATAEPVVITITDKGGKNVRVIRNPRAEPGVTRYVWDLRYDNPAVPAVARISEAPAAVPTETRSRFGGGNLGPAVLPGDYNVKVRIGGRELAGSVHVMLDPNVQAAEADLQAQIDASFTMLSMVARVNTIIDRVNDAVTQLTSLETVLTRQTPAAPVLGNVKQALDKLRVFRDDELARPLPGLGYRQYPRLREDVQSIAGGLGRGFRAPNEGEKLRMKELAELTDKAAAKLNGMIAGDIAKINEAIKASPRIAVESVK